MSQEAFKALQNTYSFNRKECIIEAIDDDIVVVNLQSGKYYNVTAASAKVLELVLDGYSPESIITASKADTVSFTTMLATFINQLREESIIIVSEAEPKVYGGNINASELTMAVFTDMQEMLELDPIHESDEQMGWPYRKEAVEPETA